MSIMLLSKMIIERGTPLLKTVVIKLHNIRNFLTIDKSFRSIHSFNCGSAVSKEKCWLQKTTYCKQIFLMKQPCRLFRNMQYSGKIETKFRKMDKIPEEFELIYKGPLHLYIYLAQIVVLVSTSGLVGIISYKQISGRLTMTFPFQLEDKTTSIYEDINANATEMLIYIAAFSLFNIMLYGIILRYPLRIYCHKSADSYTCVMNGLIPSLTYKINYCSGDVRRSKFLFMKFIPWRENFFKIGSKTVLLLDNYFRTPVDFSMMINEK